jgi:5'-3' exoribonuclease 1
MNGIIHMATHNNADSFIETNEEEMFKRIFIYTDRLYKLVAPTRLMFLAVDGVAPRAKMNQQRSRRFRSAKEAEQSLAELVAREGAMPDGDRFDSNCITPGTDFMYNLGTAFREWIAEKMQTDPFWQSGARVVFSGPDVPGEGEHKVMDYIRYGREHENDWAPDLRHCLYGLDADLIMLSLVTHEPHFHLLREKMSVRHSRKRKPKDPINYTRDDFELLRVSMLREMLRLQFKSHAADASLPFTFQLERVIDDFVFMCILVGNDFLPNMPHLDIADGALNSMISIYKEMLPSLGGYMTYKDEVRV